MTEFSIHNDVQFILYKIFIGIGEEQRVAIRNVLVC